MSLFLKRLMIKRTILIHLKAHEEKNANQKKKLYPYIILFTKVRLGHKYLNSRVQYQAHKTEVREQLLINRLL
jgi:hypothetical protein